MNLENVKTLLNRVSFRDWWFRCGELGDGSFVQVCFNAACTVSGEVEEQRGRKYYISPYAISDEVLKTCWVAIEAALKHEAMEDFKIDGIAPFHPHTNIEYLIDLQSAEAHVHRVKEDQPIPKWAADAVKQGWAWFSEEESGECFDCIKRNYGGGKAFAIFDDGSGHSSADFDYSFGINNIEQALHLANLHANSQGGWD